MVYSQCGRKEWLNTHEKISRFPSVLATKPNPGQSGTALRHCLYGKFIYIYKFKNILIEYANSSCIHMEGNTNKKHTLVSSRCIMKLRKYSHSRTNPVLWLPVHHNSPRIWWNGETWRTFWQSSWELAELEEYNFYSKSEKCLLM